MRDGPEAQVYSEYVEHQVEITRRQFQDEEQHVRIVQVEGKDMDLDLDGRLKRCERYARWRWLEFHTITGDKQRRNVASL